MRQKLKQSFTNIKAVIGNIPKKNIRAPSAREIGAGFSETFTNLRGLVAAKQDDLSEREQEGARSIGRRLSTVNILLLLGVVIETLIAISLILLIARLA